MLRVKQLYSAFFIMLIMVFIFLSIIGKMRIFYFFIMMVLLAPSGYIYSYMFTYLLLAVSWLILFPGLVFIYRAGALSSILIVAVFNIMVLAYFLYKRILNTEDIERDKELKDRDGERFIHEERYENTKRFENGIKAKELSLVNIYEVTRQMSEHLKFEEIFKTLSLFLSDNFQFKKCDLLIFNNANNALSLDRAYSILSDNAGQISTIKIKNKKIDKLISIFAGKFSEVYLTREKDSLMFEDLGLADLSISSIAIIPLLSERKLDGIFLIENLPKNDLERFAVLSMQFALEIKKVLLYETVERLAVTDSLTGLYVRRYFYERFDEELQRAKKFNFELAFIMLDIDDFKRCNDTYGHLVGDVVLKDIAKIIKESVREIDIVARYGGEEFAIVLPEAGGENAMAVADRLRLKVYEHIFKAYDEKLRITVSVGLVIYPRDGVLMNEIIDKSDEALYNAKKLGKNVVCEYKK